MKDPAFLFYSKEFYEGTRTMFPEERACYIDLLIYQHQHDGVIPDDMRRLLLYCTGVDEATLKATLEAKFKRGENGWYNEALNGVMNERKEHAKTQSMNGKIGQFFKKITAKHGENYANKVRTALKKHTKDEIFAFVNALQSIEKQDIEATLKATLQASLKGSHKHLANAIADADAIANIDKRDKGGTEGKEKPPITPMVVDLRTCTVTGNEWRTDFKAYQSALRGCYQVLKKDEAWLAERKRLNPRVDIPLTLDKVCIDYWATEEGWAKKKQGKSQSINWKTTLAKSIGQKFNHVYDNGTGNNQTQRRGNALTGDYLENLARRAMSVDGMP